MIEFVIEGHDGSAKTPIADGVKNKLVSKGISCEVYAPFHIANDLLGHDIYSLWDNNASMATSLLSDITQNLVKENSGLEVVLYDRYWLTIMGEIQDKTIAWNHYPLTFFIEAKPAKTMDCKRFSYDIPWTSSMETVEFHYQRKMSLLKKYNQYVLGHYEVKDKGQNLKPIIDSITEQIMRYIK